ncbi:hypothetical protein KGM_202221 [Danaus plexippus plexippus]|uniref:Uncharacterized protein n=1 Tax=Danaus plexippus plexippus TaxID=278856 RepID=A0A212FIR5_DANPL|nr:hypothetical protein KGM_202221 [Danaus plexippus plexippus]
MNFLSDIYQKSLHENEKNIKFWEEYLQNLNTLNFEIYSDKLSVPILVPIGNKILFRGALKHTNEVTVALGADYFAKCSIKQAEVLRQHRIKDAKSKLEEYNKEKEYLENQLSFGKQNVFGNTDQDIIEVCTEEEDKTWREQHRERLKRYHQSDDKKKENISKDISDEELWMRLEELELQEEMQNEMQNSDTVEETNSYESNFDSCVIKESDVKDVRADEATELASRITHNVPKQTSKTDLLQQVLDRQEMLSTKLTELKSRDRPETTTESELLSRLDEIELLDDLEDEMDRIDDILETAEDEDSSRSDTSKSSKSVSFTDEDDGKTLELTFTHTDVEPDMTPYDPEKGIMKPRDIYVACANLFNNGTTSILRKSKYLDKSANVTKEMEAPQAVNKNGITDTERQEIVVRDVVEKSASQENLTASARPTSLFKQKRQQKS